MNPDAPAARLYREPFAFDFFQAVRLLEALRPDRKPVGRDGPPAAEVVRFASRQSLAFPAAAVHRLDPPGDDDGPPRMAVNFFGLTGPNGVLPTAYTQWLYARERTAGDPEANAAGEWFDQFTRRMLGLFYRAWAKYRLPVGYETAARTGGPRDAITTAAVALIGLGTPGLEDRFRDHGIEDVALLRYANLFAAATRPAAGLERLLADYFEVPVTVIGFHGRWQRLDVENQTRLGRTGTNDRLGDGTVVGRRVWDLAGGIRVRVGPLSRADFREWLPDRPRLRVLAALVRFYTRDGFDFDVQVVLAAADVPPLKLVRPEAGVPPRLGWNTWVAARPPAADAADAVFRRDELVKAGH